MLIKFENYQDFPILKLIVLFKMQVCYEPQNSRLRINSHCLNEETANELLSVSFSRLRLLKALSNSQDYVQPLTLLFSKADEHTEFREYKFQILWNSGNNILPHTGFLPLPYFTQVIHDKKLYFKSSFECFSINIFRIHKLIKKR